MAGVPTFATAPFFLGLERARADARIHVAGIPLDIGTTNRSGARFGPQAIRHASRMLVDGAHPGTWRDPVTLPVADIGDFAIALGHKPARRALSARPAAGSGHLVALGGEHAVTLPLLRALAARQGGPVGLVHFDAHVDTWPDSFGQAYGHGSPFYHAIREGIVDPGRMIQLGIRSPVQREVWDWPLAQGVTVLTAQDVHEMGAAAAAARVAGVVGDGPAYLSFDIDALDPAFAPGTGTPEIGGLASWQVQAILRRLSGVAWAGMDVVEVAPAYDSAEVTALAAATIVWEYLALAGGRYALGA